MVWARDTADFPGRLWGFKGKSSCVVLVDLFHAIHLIQYACQRYNFQERRHDHWSRRLARWYRKSSSPHTLYALTIPQLAGALLEDPKTPDVQLILCDIVEPKAPKGAKHVITKKADLCDPKEIDALFKTDFGIPDTIYCFHGIMSRGSEDNFDLGVKVGRVIKGLANL
jgi:hypothetical protein